MKVILIDDVYGLGRRGEVANVADGYGRNYLIPQGLASLADPKKIKAIEHQKRALEAKRRRELDKTEALAAEINGLEFTFARKSAETGQIFGSVTPADIEKAIHAKGYEAVTRKMIHVERPIKMLGEFEVTVKFHGGISAPIKVVVEKQEEEE